MKLKCMYTFVVKLTARSMVLGWLSHRHWKRYFEDCLIFDRDWVYAMSYQLDQSSSLNNQGEKSRLLSMALPTQALPSGL